MATRDIIDTKNADYVVAYCNVPLASGHKYSFQFSTFSIASGDADYSQSSAIRQNKSIKVYDTKCRFDIDADEKGIAFAIYEYDENGDVVPHRISSFDTSKIFAELRYIEEDETELPSYYDEYIDDRIKTINERWLNSETPSYSGDIFAWLTDAHYGDNSQKSYKLLNYIAPRVGMSKFFDGGDIPSGGSGTWTKSEMVSNLAGFMAYYDNFHCDCYHIIGNHEWNDPAMTIASNRINAETLYNLILRPNEGKYKEVSPNRMGYWVDNAIQKIRYICLSCNYGAYVAKNTVIWFADVLNAVPEGYTCVIFSHNALHFDDQGVGTPTGNYNCLIGCMDAAKVGGSYTGTLDGTSYTFTFNNAITIAAMFAGHTHRDYTYISSGGIPVIVTTCDRHSKDSSDDLTKEVRKAGTIGEHAFDIVQLDTLNRKIYLTRIGGSIVGASYDSETGKVYDTETGTGTEYTGAEWVAASTHKDREYSY